MPIFPARQAGQWRRRCAVVAVLAMTAGAGPLSDPAAAANQGMPSLPAIPDTLAANGSCTTPSTVDVPDTPWPQQFLGVSDVWPLTEGQGVTVAVVDTGIDVRSPALAGQVTAVPATADAGDSVHDCVGHGTFVAGIIGAHQRDGVGFAGIAPAVHILAVRATDQNGNATAATIAAGIRAAAADGAQVIDVSLGVSAPDLGLQQAVDYAVGRGAVVVAPSTVDDQSAGAQTGGPRYPADYPNVLSVASIGPDGARPGASTTTPTAAPDLVAPGQLIVSIGPGGTGDFVGNGASFAAAFVAGAAALVRTYRSGLTPAQVVNRLEATADRPSGVVPDPLLGYGTVDPLAAVSTLLPAESGVVAHVAPPSVIAPIEPEPPVFAVPDALLVAGGAGLFLLLLGAGAIVIRSGRRRGWRPAGMTDDDTPAG